MQYTNIIEGRNLQKSYRHFELDIPSIDIPGGFATALIGENGAGKTTLLDMLEGIRPSFKGSIRYFDKYEAHRTGDAAAIKSAIGYAGGAGFFSLTWSIGQVERIASEIFPDFCVDDFRRLCGEMGVFDGKDFTPSLNVGKLSDGTKMKLALALVLARRDTDMLILDEPASALDPIMRDKLCDLLRTYISSREGRSILFSTHNISDMENVTDYAIIMHRGGIAEQGFVDDLKEKYVLVKGEARDAEAAKPHMFSFTEGSYGFEGLCLASELDRLAGLDITTERPSLFRISVAVLKKYSFVR